MRPGTLLLGMPVSWRRTLQQYVGRLRRLHENKTEVQVYDYVDVSVPMLAAHHLTIDCGKRYLMIAALRYSDQYVKIDGVWLFAERLLYVDWLEERALS